MFSLKDFPTVAAHMFSAYVSLATFVMLVTTMTKNLISQEFQSRIYSILHHFFAPLISSEQLTLVIQSDEEGKPNQVHQAAEIYLKTKIDPLNNRLRVNKTPQQKTINLELEKGQQVLDIFDNRINLKWYLNEGWGSSLELTFHKKYYEKVIGSYLPYVINQADAIKEMQRVPKLRSSGLNSNMELHPATFENIAMDPELKRTIVEDLDMFVRRKDFYKKVGKAWKRGYLLYGPPGTGKSMLVAAMANYLKFDVYDMELTNIDSNWEFRSALMSIANRSILVIEDIDSSGCLRNEVTLSGLFNFIDGLWSSCGDERIIVFTTNYKDRLEPALLRPGRMDMHIHLSYCTVGGFRMLAATYLGIHDGNRHRLCDEIEGLIESTEVTPAEVCEQLMKSDDVDVVLGGLVEFLKWKKVEGNKTPEIGDDQGAKIQEMDDNNVDCEASGD